MTFFSGTDQATLRAEGSAMPHFVSLIVNNEGTYCAKITRKVTLSASKVTYPTWEGKSITEETEIPVNEYLEVFPLDIQIDEDTSIRDEILQRIREIENEKKSRPPVNLSPKYPITDRPYVQKTEDEDEPWWKTPRPDVRLKSPVQGTLFPSKKEETPTFKKAKDGSYVNIEVPKDIVRRTFIQLITGSVTAGFSDKFDIRQWTDKVMDKAFKRRFPDRNELLEWVDFYVEWIVWNTDFPGGDRLDDEMKAAAVADALLEESSYYTGGDVLALIETKLEEFI